MDTLEFLDHTAVIPPPIPAICERGDENHRAPLGKTFRADYPRYRIIRAACEGFSWRAGRYFGDFKNPAAFRPPNTWRAFHSRYPETGTKQPDPPRPWQARIQIDGNIKSRRGSLHYGQQGDKQR